MFLKFKINVGEYKAGEIALVSEESVARGYIAANVAEESNQEDQIKSLVAGQLAASQASLKEELKETFRSIMDGAKSNGPPSKGVKYDENGVPFDRVEGGSASADRNVKGDERTSFTEVMQLVYKSRYQNTDFAERAWADKRLKTHYVTEVIHHTADEKESTERSFDAADYRNVERAGTESVTGGAWAGYLVRPEYINSLFQIASEEQVIEPFAFNIPVGQTNNFSWPAMDQYFTPAKGQSAVYGGVQVFRKGEQVRRQESDPKLRNIEFKITDLTGFSYLSRDLVMDNFIAADQIVQNVFGMAMAWRKDWEFINGDGVGKPLGILKSAALLTIANRANGNKIAWEDIAGMLALFHQSRIKNAMFIANQTTYTELLVMKNAAGNYVFNPNSSVTQATPLSLIDRTTSTGLKYAAQGTLAGFPIRFTEKLPTLGTSGDIMLIDPTQYGVATRMGLEIGVSEHFAFDTDQIAYRFKIRNEGQPLWSGPYISADSANTKFSPFIKLPA